MPDTDPTMRRGAAGARRRDPGAPKGRPTPGRKQRNEAARARARRDRLVLRAWLIGAGVVVMGLLTALVVSGVGAGTAPHLGG